MGRFLWLIIFFSFSSTSCFKTTPPTLAICAIFKNEAPWLKEWIDYHHHVLGVNTFYLYNNDSTDGFQEILSPYIEEGIVELFDWGSSDPTHWAYGRFMDAPWSAAQLGAYNDCLKNKALGKVDWVAMIDIDEFIVPSKSASQLYKLLRQAEKKKKGTVSIHWKTFGTSNVKDLAEGELLTEKLTRSSVQSHPLNKHVKSIHRPEAVAFTLVHISDALNPGYGAKTLPVNEVTLHHYWTRTEDYCEQKRKCTKESDPKLFSDLFQEEDKTIHQYLPLYKRL